jgi:hypothetical protein
VLVEREELRPDREVEREELRLDREVEREELRPDRDLDLLLVGDRDAIGLVRYN